jgi:hypothetical protein
MFSIFLSIQFFSLPLFEEEVMVLINPVSFRTLTPLCSFAEHITEIEGLAEVNGYIDEVVDVNTEAVNETLTLVGQFSIAGHKIKVAGADPNLQVKVMSGLIPALSAGTWKVEIKTQYTGSDSTMLKNLWVIEGGMTLTVLSGLPDRGSVSPVTQSMSDPGVPRGGHTIRKLTRIGGYRELCAIF